MDKEGSFDIIRRHLYEDQSIELSSKQKELLDRWECIIELRTCERIGKKEIIAKTMERFKVERATAFTDFNNALDLFGYSITINKRNKIAARIEFLEEYIDQLRTANEHKAAAAQEANLLKYYDLYPDLKKEQPRKLSFIYNAAPTEELMPIVDAEYILMEAAKHG